MKLPSRRRVRQAIFAFASLMSLAVFLVCVNGLALASRTTPTIRHVSVPLSASASGPGEVTILAYNIAKGFVHKGGVNFDSRANVETRLRQMAKVIHAERPDFVFLSEAIFSCGPCDIDQPAFLAEECGMPHLALGENYNVGLPFYRIAGGNAILSNRALVGVANVDLAGRKPFYVTRNNRRALIVTASIGGRDVLLAAVHNDSFDMRNNEVQARQLIEFVGDRPAVIAGDFNNRPEERSMKAFRECGRFSGAFAGPPTFFEGARAERLDYILAPTDWELLDHRVIANDASDHRPVVCRFRVAK